MKISASGGTDGATIVLFWPENLPEDADELLKGDPIELIERLRAEGKLIWFLCDGDGGYTVAIYLRSELPADLVACCRDEEKIPALHVCDVGYFGGAEYMFERDSSFLEKHPHMCERVSIPAGVYAARVFRTEVSDELYETWLVTHAGKRAKRLWDLHSKVASFAVASVFASIIAFFVVPRTMWLATVAIMTASAFVAVMMSRSEWYKSVAQAREAFDKAYPAYVVHLE